jgi:hypothetical protein
MLGQKKSFQENVPQHSMESLTSVNVPTIAVEASVIEGKILSLYGMMA